MYIYIHVYKSVYVYIYAYKYNMHIYNGLTEYNSFDKLNEIPYNTLI